MRAMGTMGDAERNIVGVAVVGRVEMTSGVWLEHPRLLVVGRAHAGMEVRFGNTHPPGVISTSLGGEGGEVDKILKLI